MRNRNPSQTKEKLIQAAAQLVIVNGTTHVTLEQVALEAGVSKGGLLHHFPTKLALFNGLIEAVGQVFNARLEEHLRLEPAGQPGRFARAYIQASFEYEADELQLTNAIAKVVVEFPELLHQLQADFTMLDQKMQADGLHAARSIVIRLACDGLWFSELLGISNFQGSMRAQMFNELIALTKPESTGFNTTAARTP